MTPYYKYKKERLEKKLIRNDVFKNIFRSYWYWSTFKKKIIKNRSRKNFCSYFRIKGGHLKW